MNILFYGNRQAGLVGLLTALASEHNVYGIFTDTEESAEMFGRAINHPIPILPVVAGLDDLRQLRAPIYDVLLGVHGRRKIPAEILGGYPLGGVNVHPFLKEFPGANPVGRALESGTRVMAVSSHQMTEDIDAGPQIYTARSNELLPMRAPGPGICAEAVEATYNRLYPLYAECVRETLKLLVERPT